MKKLEALIIKYIRAIVCSLFVSSFLELVLERRRAPRGEGKQERKKRKEKESKQRSREEKESKDQERKDWIKQHQWEY